jgi:hypothetical protein
MTSMEKQLGKKLPMNEALNVLKNQLKTALGISFENCHLSDLEGLLKV